MKVPRFLHGDWLGHPLHPILAHLPMALWPSALVFDLLSWAGIGGNAMVQTALYATGLGVIGGVLAVPFGLADWSDVGRDKPAWKIGLFHMIFNLIALGIWGTNLGLRFGEAFYAERTPVAPLVLSVVGTLVLALSGYLGGRMVYGYGTYVGWMAIKKWRRIAEEHGANVPPQS